MRRAFIRLLVLGAPLALRTRVSGPGRADEPLPSPTRKTIWSNNRRFFAVTDPKDWTTTIYRATPDGKGSKNLGDGRLSPLRLARRRRRSSRGRRPRLGMDLSPSITTRDMWSFTFLRRGELINKLTIGQVQVIGDLPKLGHTASSLHRGGIPSASIKTGISSSTWIGRTKSRRGGGSSASIMAGSSSPGRTRKFAVPRSMHLRYSKFMPPRSDSHEEARRGRGIGSSCLLITVYGSGGVGSGQTGARGRPVVAMPLPTHQGVANGCPWTIAVNLVSSHRRCPSGTGRDASITRPMLPPCSETERNRASSPKANPKSVLPTDRNSCWHRSGVILFIRTNVSAASRTLVPTGCADLGGR